MIRWVAFDLDDTIFNGTLLVEKARRAAVSMMVQNGLPVDLEYAIKILDEIIIEFGTNSENHLDYLLMRLQNDPKVRLPHDLNFNKLVAAGVIGYHREKVKHFKLFRDVNSTLQELHQRGIKTAIITDGMPKKQYEKILRLQLEGKMDKIIISDEVAIRKPNPQLFSQFLDVIKCQPQEVIYIGDRLERDIEPAQKAGLRTALIHRGTKYDPYITKVISNIKPDFHLRNLHELIHIIEGINQNNRPQKK